MNLTIECDGLSAGWSGDALIENFRLAKEKLPALGHVLPIVGRTGRGKSTLLYALSGMSMPMTGRVSWFFPDRESPTSWSAADGAFKAGIEVRQRRFGFLLQDASMIPCFTIGENLRHMLRLRGINDDLDERARRAVASMLIDGEAPKKFLDRYPVQLSGGERQRMALAAAIAHDPAVVFADEPTASLDDPSGLEVLAVIRRWLDERKGGRAFICVTHRRETLRPGLRACQALELRSSGNGTDSKIVADWLQL